MKISKLVEMLNQAKRELGNIEVAISSDEEGNSLGSLEADYLFGKAKCDGKKHLIIYPTGGVEEDFEDFDEEEVETILAGLDKQQ